MQSGGDLTTGSDTIPHRGPDVDGDRQRLRRPGTMGTTATSLGSWTGGGNAAGTQTYQLANSWNYRTGIYTATITYTLTAP